MERYNLSKIDFSHTWFVFKYVVQTSVSVHSLDIDGHLYKNVKNRRRLLDVNQYIDLVWIMGRHSH